MPKLKKHFFSTTSSKGMEKRKKSLPPSTKKGFALTEVMTAIGLYGIFAVVAGSLTYGVIMAFNFSRSTMDREQLWGALKSTIGNEESCKLNLKPSASPSSFPTTEGTGTDGLYNDGTTYTASQGIGKLAELNVYKGGTKSGNALVKIGDFGQNLEIVKLALEKTGANPFNSAQTTEVGDRELIAYFKHKRGHQRQQDSSKKCDNTGVGGCFKFSCRLQAYYLHTGSEKCQSATCRLDKPSSGGTGNVDKKCYKVDPTGETYIGCLTNPDSRENNTQTTTTAFGFDAGKDATGGYNTLIGWKAGRKITTGYSNTIIGYQAGENNISGLNNTFIGLNTGRANTATSDNVFIGSSVGGKNKANGNVFIGAYAGSENTTSGGNVFIGHDAGLKNTASENMFIGFESGEGNTIGTRNLFIGYRAGKADKDVSPAKNVTGNDNIAIGYQAGEGITTGGKNLFIGYQAGRSDLYGTTKTYVTSSENTAIGYQSGSKITSGEHNTFIGYQAGKDTNTGSYNNFVGKNAGAKNTDGTRNAFFGDGAGAKQVTCNNTQAGTNGTKYCQNTFFGHYTGHNMNGGFRNVFFGAASGHDATNSKNNTFMGANAGKHTTGSGNTFFGAGAGHGSGEDTKTTTAITIGSDNIFIGKEVGLHNIGGVSKTRSRQLNIGNLLFGILPDMNACKENLKDSDTSGCTGGGTTAEKNDAKNFFGSDYLSGKKGLAINGDLYIVGALKSCDDDGSNCSDIMSAPAPTTPPSSRVFKNTITLFKNYQYALSVINNTPLFNYYYNKDHPKHKRMGVISEDLPKHLQIQDKNEPIQPDWVSIYGTLWAGIKALFNKFISFKKEVTQKFASVIRDIKKLIHNDKELKKEIETLKKENIRIIEQIKALRKEKGVK